MSLVPREVRQLAKAVAQADDAAMRRVVSLVDGLQHRGELDCILESLRPRLRGLCQPRPLRLARLLFLPLDGAIVPAQSWVRNQAKIPRSAVPVLADAVEQALGGEAPALLDLIAGRTTEDTAVIEQVGGVIWPLAAEHLPAQPPRGWAADTGLGEADYALITGLCRPVWANGCTVWNAQAAAPDGPPPELATAALRAVLPAGLGALAIVLATLMMRAAAPGTLARIAAELSPAAREMARSALDAVIDAPLPDFTTLTDESAAAAALALGARLDDLAETTLLDPKRRQRLVAVRRLAEESYRSAFLADVDSRFSEPLRNLAGQTAADDAEVVALETAARSLRLRESAGRALGGARAYDLALQQLGEDLSGMARDMPESGGLALIDVVRAMEIMFGPQAAASLLPVG